MFSTHVPITPKSNWEQQKDKLKLKFPTLTNADLNFDESNKFEMLTQLQVKVGRTVKELQVIIETL
jgi:thymidylate synthase